MPSLIDSYKTEKESKMKKLRVRLSKISVTVGIFCLFIISTNSFTQTKSQKIGALLGQYHEYGQFNGAALVAES
jgi:hypothetical protein